MKTFLSRFDIVAAFLALGLAGTNQTTAAPANTAPAKARPNFLIILADDLGFSDIGCYGGEIATPNLDTLAANGLRFTQFYNTGRCWPTRASLMTGHYAQQVRMDPVCDRLPQGTRVLPHYLRPLGYRSYHVGKWHVRGAPKPVADGGFDRSYWFEDWDRYFTPARHFKDDQQLPPTKPEDGYYATTAFADHAITCLKEHGVKHGGKPFFLYLAFIAPHFPLHALPEDIARHRARYRAGWDEIRAQRSKKLREMGIANHAPPPLDVELTPRYLKKNIPELLGPGEVLHAMPWDRLTDEQKQFQATKMALHAAMVDRMDREIGRVLDQLRAMGVFENTVVFFLSDNGADATLLVRGEGHDPGVPPGSAKSFLCVGPGWASASNTPFRRHKIWTHEGGISTPLVVHWPAGIKARGELRRDMGHVVDFVPTLLELAGGKASDEWNGVPTLSLAGKSLVPDFARDGAVSREFLYFHHEGNRALRMGDWKLVSAREDNDAWELFDLSTDRGETKNLAASQPDRLKAMEAKWRQLDTQFQRDGERP